MLRLGDTGSQVTSLTTQLASRGFNIRPTSTFSVDVETAVLEFQRTNDLVTDGIVGPKTWSVLFSAKDGRLLRQKDLNAAAERLDAPIAAIMAVNEVESRGHGFLSSGRPTLLFERHIMRRQMRKNGIETNVIGLAEQRWPGLVNRQTGGYQGGEKEHQRLQQASDIHRQSALESASWGQFQVMGFHWQPLGYDSIDQFVQHMCATEAHQLRAFVRLIKANNVLLNALRSRNWPAFAAEYNGPAYTKNQYDTKLAAAYARYKSIAA
jgi:hypothetical protein